jgi:phosphoribosyl-ATP pyrophosphohydrolase/phosphoribosyl-AMP cyclohydrolase
MNENAIHRVAFDERGLIAAIVQDASTNEVIALLQMDNAGLMATLTTGRASFHSEPGHESPGPFRVVDVRANSDGRSITVLVEAESGRTVRERPVSLLRDLAGAQKAGSSEVSLVDAGSMELGLMIDRLYTLVAERREKRPEGSYTTYLFNSGLDKILKKVAEEAGEVIVAAKNSARPPLVSELADLFYHLLVLMVEREIKPGDVHGELARRAAQAPNVNEGA